MNICAATFARFVRQVSTLLLVLSIALGGFTLDLGAQAGTASSATTGAKHTTVLFMCPHGAAKSVLASAYFQQLAKERGLNVHVDAVGTDPEPAVSKVVAEHLQKNGYAVPITKPRAVTAEDVNAADVVVSLGCDVTRVPGTPRALQRWDEVPGPGEDFAAADEAIRRRVVALVEELVARQHK